MAPFPPSLVPAARSAYRAVLRASRITFAGDAPRRAQMDAAVRQTFQSPTLTSPHAPPPPADSPSEATEADLAKKIQEWVEVAQFLRKNVVQGELDESGSYRLRVTPDTDLGDNTSIRDPPKLPTTPFPNRNRKRCGEA